MSSLTKTEKQALNDLFVALKEKKDLSQRIKNIKRSFIFVLSTLLKFKKVKNPSV